ncbi:hypothetical protein BDM02DRAFT_3183528 [Thelephora ganbajun]|uniref:Uncharacterized protein n=1 Tax=Thelephora ganbajun TaxID=370292 RepID=A0ACB6ZTN8_THEGA|nr:hypothetical protein BDM02DRAFT_3183528 [Thelephora ganbajun]
MSQSPSDSRDTSPNASRDSDYPPQRHAGAVGLGPEFGKGATIGERVDGLKQEIKGKINHDPKLVEHGRDQHTGELRRREMRQDLAPLGQSHQTDPDNDKHQQEYANQE